LDIISIGGRQPQLLKGLKKDLAEPAGNPDSKNAKRVKTQDLSLARQQGQSNFNKWDWRNVNLRGELGQ
jgi:hypothetical protein